MPATEAFVIISYPFTANNDGVCVRPDNSRNQLMCTNENPENISAINITKSELRKIIR